MNIFNDETILLRSHYYITKNKETEYSIPIHFNGKTVYITKDYRGYNYQKLTHTHIQSLIRVLGFSYLGFDVKNIDRIIDEVKMRLHTPATRDEMDASTTDFILTKDNKLIQNKKIIYSSDKNILSLDVIKARFLWPCTNIPVIVPKKEQKFQFNYKEPLELHKFVQYINAFFKSNISTVIQSPLILVFNDLNVKYTIYKITNNLNMFSKNICPSIFDYMIVNTIVDYIKTI